MTDSTQSDELPPLTMTTDWPRPDVCLVRLAGGLDIATAPVLADYLREQTASTPTHLLLDLAAVKFLAAAGVTLIVNALRNNHGINGQLHVIGTIDNPQVERVLNLTGLLAVLAKYPSVEHALRHLDNLGRN